jgi:hypothetical protein
MNPVSNYAQFFTRSYLIAPFILYILLAVLLLTFGWRRAGKLLSARSTRLLRAGILALVITPAFAFMDGITLLPFLLAATVAIVSPARAVPIVNLLALLASWVLFSLFLKKDPTAQRAGPGGARSTLLWTEVALAFAYFGYIWNLVLAIPVMHYFFELYNKISSRFDFRDPFRLDEILYLFSMAFLVALATYACVWLYYRTARWAAGKGWFVVILFLLLSLALGLLLFPASCDTHESWKDEPNRICDCVGVSFRYYPVMIMDASTIDYCLGWEIPVK